MNGEIMEAPPPEPDGGRGSFQQRFVDRRVDLLAASPVAPEPLPGSCGMLLGGKRHLLAAPRRMGKTIGTLVLWVQMGVAGVRIVILDVENGSDVYGLHLKEIVGAFGLDDGEIDRLRRNLTYYRWPRLRMGDTENFVAQCRDADVVVFDSQRRFLTDLGLNENESDDYSMFMRSFVDPLSEIGVATFIQDNTGHADRSRSRGSSTKGDLNEIVLTLEGEPFSLEKTSRLELKVGERGSRFGEEVVCETTIGGGRFERWRRVEPRPRDVRETHGGEEFLPARTAGFALIESVSRLHLHEAAWPGICKTDFERASVCGSRQIARKVFDALVAEAASASSEEAGVAADKPRLVKQTRGTAIYLRIEPATLRAEIAEAPQ
jgi:hypothetical protein